MTIRTPQSFLGGTMLTSKTRIFSAIDSYKPIPFRIGVEIDRCQL
jgi:hypothetical protein